MTGNSNPPTHVAEHDRRIAVLEATTTRDREDFITLRAEVKKRFDQVDEKMDDGFKTVFSKIDGLAYRVGEEEMVQAGLRLKTKVLWGLGGLLLTTLVGAVVKVALTGALF
jgi:hypothetical protein